MDNVSLEEPKKVAAPISVFPTGPVNTVNPDYAQTMASRADLALDKASPGMDVIKNAILQGDTERYQELARRDAIVKFEDTKLLLAREVIRNAEGREPTPQEADAFMSLSLAQAEAGQSQTIIEQNFARKYVTTASVLDPEDDSLDNAVAEDEAAANNIMDIAESATTRNVIAQDKLTEITDELAKTGIVDKAWDFAENMIPFKSMWNFHDLTKGAPTSSILTGNNVEEQIAYLHTLPPDEFKKQYTAAIEELRGRNIYDALAFAQAVIAFSSSDKFWSNAQDVLDIGGVLAKPIGGAVRIASKTVRGAATERFATRMKGVVNGAVHAPKDIPAAAAKAGHTSAAAKATVFTDTLEGRLLGQNIKDLKQLEQKLPNALSPNKTWLKDSSLPPVAVARIEELSVARNARMLDFLKKPDLIERLAPTEVAKAIEEAAHSLRKTFNNVAHNVIDVIENPAEKSIANVHSVTIRFGKPDGTLFETAQKAQSFTKKLVNKSEDYSVVSHPGGFAVEVTKNVDETSGGLRALRLETTEKAPASIQTKMWGYIRNANDQVSQFNRGQRSVGVMTEEYMANLVHDMVQPFKKMPRQQMHELSDVIGEAQVKFNPNTGTTGVYYKSASEFEVAFQNSTGKLPTPDQVDAYFTFVDMNDLDLAVRSLDIYKQKARMGIEQFEIDFAGKPIKFEGKEVKNLPFGSKDYFTVRVVDNGKITRKLNNKIYKDTDKNALDLLVNSGEYKIIQSANGPLQLGDEAATFILVKEAKRSRVSVMSIPRKEGGHQIYKDGYYVKQADLRKTHDGATNYHGDRTLYSAHRAEDAQAFANDYNELIRLWKTDRAAAVNLIRNKMPFSAQEFYADIQKGVIDLDNPIAAVKSGQTAGDVLDLAKSNPYFNNLTRSEHNLNGRITGRFLGERADHIIDTVKSEANGVYSSTTSPFINPMQALGNTMSDTIRTRVMNDYTISSVQSWYKQFSHLLDTTPEQMDVFGVDFLMNPVYKAGANAAEKQAAENVRMSISNLVNNSTDVSKRIAAKKDKIVSSVYNKFGDGAANWVSDHLLPTVSNVDVYARSFAFHSKLGFFNPIQLFLQASAFTNAVAIGGKSGVKGAASYPAFAAAIIKSDPKITAGIAKKMKVFGWKEDHFKEAVEAYRQSGFHVVGKDVGYLDDMRGPDIKPLRSKVPGLSEVSEFITEKGTLMFRNGERIPRVISFATSYDQWRKANPKALFDRRARALVLDRAKLLAGNMTRDSNARWQRGWPSMATQFFAYQARMSEMFIGKRLTNVEKARLFAMNSFLYGAPVGAAGVTAIMPWRDYLKEELYSNGVEIDNTWAEPAMDGVLSSIVEYATGYDFDIGGRYGPGGITTFYDMWNGDAEMREAMVGASGSILADTIASAKPFMKGIWSAIDLDDQTVYPVLMEDVVAVLRNISTVDNAVKYYNFTKVGAWVSKNYNTLTNVDAFEAWVAALTGISPDRVGDSFAHSDATKQIKDRKRNLEKEWIKTIKKAANQSDPELAARMRTSVKTEMIANGMSTQESNRVWKQALDEQPLTEAIAEQYQKNVTDYLNRIKK